MVEKTDNEEKRWQQDLRKTAAEFVGAWSRGPMAKKAGPRMSESMWKSIAKLGKVVVGSCVIQCWGTDDKIVDDEIVISKIIHIASWVWNTPNRHVTALPVFKWNCIKQPATNSMPACSKMWNQNWNTCDMVPALECLWWRLMKPTEKAVIHSNHSNSHPEYHLQALQCNFLKWTLQRSVTHWM